MGYYFDPSKSALDLLYEGAAERIEAVSKSSAL